MRTEKEIREELERFLTENYPFDGSTAMHNAGIITTLKWVLQDEIKVGDKVIVHRPTYQKVHRTVTQIDPERKDGKIYRVQYTASYADWCSKDELDLVEKKTGTIEDGVTKETVDKWFESFKELSGSSDMERIMKEAYQREKIDQRFRKRKPIEDNPDADIIPGQSNEDYPEGTDEEWVRNAKESCEETLRSAEEAVKIIERDDIHTCTFKGICPHSINGEWIAVKDKLPTKRGRYLCYDERQGLQMVVEWMWDFENREWIFNTDEMHTTHWRKCLEPPVEEK